MARNLEQELESELEGELELESESSGETARELEGEFEGELAGELEDEFQNEGTGELELEAELTHEAQELPELEAHEREISELEGEFEDESEAGAELGELGEYESEQFFGRAFRGIGRFVRRAAPILKRIGRIAAPIVGKAVGGIFGGPIGAVLGSKLAGVAASQLSELEMEFEDELEAQEAHELAGESEALEHEFEFEANEQEASELSEHEQMAELMAHHAARSASEFETEALIGSATAMAFSPRDRAALRHVQHNLIRGAAILTRLLRMRRATRPMVRAVPVIVRSTTRILRRGAFQGNPITRERAARVMASQTRRILSNPRACVRILTRNVRSVRRLAQPGIRGVSGTRFARSRRMREF
jgi:hypothetical protein